MTFTPDPKPATTTKRPSFQFYPADWRKDAALQSCSIAARGLWLELLCIAHECVPYGHLTVNGKPMARPQLARLAGLGEREFTKLLDELLQAGVCSLTAEGAIFSRRMVKDEVRRDMKRDAGLEHGHKGAEHGAKGGRPRKDHPRSNKAKTPSTIPAEPRPATRPEPPDPVFQKPQKTLSSSSTSSSPSSSEDPPLRPLPGEEIEIEETLPEGWQELGRDEQRYRRVERNDATMQRIGTWFDRPPDTPWSIAECLVLRELQPAANELQLMENYYLARLPEGRDFRRRDLYRLLIHWPEEMDRARVWKAEA